MWCGFRRSGITVALACLVTSGVVISDTASAVRKNNYNPQQFRAVLRGLGYKVEVKNTPLTDEETKKAIKEFQTGYKLKPADGIAGPKTQDFAANIIQILQKNLNVVLKLKTPLPRNQYYGSQTEEAVKAFQKQFELKETGIADLALRQKANEEAKKILGGKPSAEPTPQSTPSPGKKPRRKPSSTPVPTATPTLEATPTPTATSTPEITPTPEATSTPEITPTKRPLLPNKK
jgi:peptidoglycan hydrolase-like protein with peptidoglycan-binding domain